MDIQDLVQGKAQDQDVEMAGFTIPVSALLKLVEDGYTQLRAYQENRTVAVWGKSRTACFTDEQLRERR